MKKFSVVMTDKIHQQLIRHLIRVDGQEDLCFATYNPSEGLKRFTGIVNHLIFPTERDREVHGNAEFFSIYLERALIVAAERREGLVFLHSHPFPGWQDMSLPDKIAENRISPSAFAVSKLPLLGLTVGNDGAWSGRFWEKVPGQKRNYKKHWCENVRVVGRKLTITYNDNLLKPNFDKNKLLRTISAWGSKTQEDISRLKIGIIGLGSVGSIIAETLSQTGISRFVLPKLSDA